MGNPPPAEFMCFKDWDRAMTHAAFHRKKEDGGILGHKYEEIAKEQGYNSYAAMRAAMKQYFGETK